MLSNNIQREKIMWDNNIVGQVSECCVVRYIVLGLCIIVIESMAYSVVISFVHLNTYASSAWYTNPCKPSS